MSGASTVSRWQQLRKWALETEGSTRSSALIRIFLVTLLWARWANDLVLFREFASPQGWVFVAIGVNFYLATTLMLVGLWTRFAGIWTASVVATMVVYAGALGRGDWGHHHTYLLAQAACLCACTPSGRSYSIDRWLAVRRAEASGEPLPPERGNLWGLRLMSLQLSSIYFWGAFDKSSFAFLSGERMEHYLMWFYLGSDRPSAGWVGALLLLIAVTTVLLEYALSVGLLFRRSRRYLLLPGIALHALFYVLVPVFTFSATMVCLYLAVVDANTVHRIIDRLHGGLNGSSSSP